MRMLAVVLLLTLLAACAGGSESSGPAKPSTAATSASTAAPTKPASGTPMPEALSKFRCGQDAKNVWAASGVVANPGKSAVTFQVTVYIGAANGGEEAARTSQVPSVAAGGSARFAIKDVPGPKTADAPCHVQVLALPRR